MSNNSSVAFSFFLFSIDSCDAKILFFCKHMTSNLGVAFSFLFSIDSCDAKVLFRFVVTLQAIQTYKFHFRSV